MGQSASKRDKREPLPRAFLHSREKSFHWHWEISFSTATAQRVEVRVLTEVPLGQWTRSLKQRKYVRKSYVPGWCREHYYRNGQARQTGRWSCDRSIG